MSSIVEILYIIFLLDLLKGSFMGLSNNLVIVT